jgi:hypothetical protein
MRLYEGAGVVQENWRSGAMILARLTLMRNPRATLDGARPGDAERAQDGGWQRRRE